MADNIAEDLLAAERLNRAVKLRARGATWPEVARECAFNDRDGNPSPAAALRAVGEAMAAATLRAEMTADQHRDEASLRLDHLLSEALGMMKPQRFTIVDENGNEREVDDRSVRLKAVDEARRLIEAQLKLNGVTAPKADESAGANEGIRIVLEDRRGDGA